MWKFCLHLINVRGHFAQGDQMLWTPSWFYRGVLNGKSLAVVKNPSSAISATLQYPVHTGMLSSEVGDPETENECNRESKI